MQVIKMRPTVHIIAFSIMIESAFTVRNRSDYEDFFVVSKSETEKQIGNARRFLETVEVYIDGLVTKST